MKYLSFIVIYSVICIIQLSAQENTSVADKPHMIMLTIPGDPAHTAAFSWRSKFADTISIAQITDSITATAPWKYSKTVKGSFSPWETGTDLTMGHKVRFSDLKPGTRYLCRVGNGEKWSEWIQFRTSSEYAEPFSFLFFGDIQNDIKSLGSHLIRQAYSHFPDARFMIFAGDLVGRSIEPFWLEFFESGTWIFSMLPSLPSPGNHEYTGFGTEWGYFSRQWQQIFTMPDNGPSDKLRERVYFVDYQGVRFISIDSPAMIYRKEDQELILNWLDQTLASNPCRWTIIFTHFPVYSCSRGRNNESYRNAIRPVLEKYGVDLVLQGHDHTYCRGQNLKEIGPYTSNPPMYVVSVAGPKMYGLNPDFWADRVASDTQLYQHISVNGDTLHFKTYTAEGKLYDAFTLIKTDQAANQVIIDPVIGTINERMNIPEGLLKQYSPEELEKIEKRKKNE